MPLDVKKIKADFPIFCQEINGKPLTYLDSGATSQKPRQVIEAMNSFYETINANVHRGAHYLGERTTKAFEDAREKVKKFINANSPKEIIFTKNATEGLNLLAHSLGSTLKDGDAILLTHMEHHANIVPWQLLAERKNIELRWVSLDEEGKLNMEELEKLADGVKIIAVSAMSNVLGTINPVKEIAKLARNQDSLVVLDACQFVPHSPTDVKELDCDFLVFSGHKMCGPTGIGVLYGKQELLEKLPPFMGGGEMIINVTTEGFITNELPWKFEPGTPPIAEAIGLGAAIDYLDDIGMENIREHEISLTAYALRLLTEKHGDQIKIYGPSEPAERGGLISFKYGDIHAHDVSQVLDEHAISVRAGHHCAKPLMQELGIGATVRASTYIYNDETEIDQLSIALEEVRDFFKLNK